MPTRTAPNIPERLAAAQREAEQLRTELETAEQELAAALERQDYKAAEQAKDRAEEVRPHLTIADATVGALQQAADAMEEHRLQEQRTAQGQARREQAQGLMEAAQAREAEAMDEMQRLLAEIKPALQAVRELYAGAVAQQQIAAQARIDAHHSGITAGHIHPTSAPPAAPNHASVLPDYLPVLRDLLSTAL